MSLNDTTRTGPAATESVILVHGLWHGAGSHRLLAWRLGRAGFRVHRFGYSSRRECDGAAVSRLIDLVRSRLTSPVHLVGHSLGGLLILEALAMAPDLPRGRVVLLGSPVKGSAVARRIRHWPLVPRLLGSAEDLLVEGAPMVPEQRQIGMIRGGRALGMGRLLGIHDRNSDGTVSAAETELPQAADRICLPVTHTGMIFSAPVAAQTAAFLRQGRFSATGQ